MDIDFLNQALESYLPAKRKRSPNGWVSFNAPCCIHNGESADTRGRGGLVNNNGGTISFHCFNCGFKTSYTPGRPISYKFRKFLRWLGASENEIRRLVIEAIRLKELIEIQNPDLAPAEERDFAVRSLPAEAVNFLAIAEFHTLGDSDFPFNFVRAVNYVYSRNINMQEYEFFWADTIENKMSYRVIVPFYWKNKLVGWTARSTEDGIKPKYFSNHEPDFVFNINKQSADNKFVIVTEGVFDAMAIDGVSVLGNNCSEIQAEIIDNLGKEVIVVPDFDQHTNTNQRKVWPGQQLIEAALEYGWTVSFPLWSETCKDVSDAVNKYGKLFALKSILDGRIDNKLKIQLMTKKLA